MFKVGQRVKCVSSVSLPDRLEKNKIYTILHCYFNKREGCEFVLLKEMHDEYDVATVLAGYTRGWFASRFVKLQPWNYKG